MIRCHKEHLKKRQVQVTYKVRYSCMPITWPVQLLQEQFLKGIIYLYYEETQQFIFATNPFFNVMTFRLNRIYRTTLPLRRNAKKKHVIDLIQETMTNNRDQIPKQCPHALSFFAIFERLSGFHFSMYCQMSCVLPKRTG